MPRNLSALVVEDEEQSAKLLQTLLEETDEFAKVSYVTSAEKARELLDGFDPDLIFVDIKLPGQDGLSFARDTGISVTGADFIFVTAHDQYAIEALQQHAFGYLLKPVDRRALRDCIHQYRRRRKQIIAREIKQLMESMERKSKLRFNTRNGYFFVDPESIVVCEAEGNYTTITTAEKKEVCTLQLGVIQKVLPNGVFVRLGRSMIINMNYLSSVNRKTCEVTFSKEGYTSKWKVKRSELRKLEMKT